MNVFTDIALRYLFSKKSTNAINIITSISVLGISIGTAAMILILSVFNGFEALIKDIVDDFNPDLKLELIEGKRFDIDDALVTQLMDIKGIEAMSKTIEEVALFEYNGIQEAGIIKGVDEMFPIVTAIDSTLDEGKYIVDDEDAYYAVTGYGLARKLSMNIDDFSTSLIIYLPKRKKKNAWENDYIRKELLPSGFFSIENEKDHQYILTSLDLIEGLLKTKGQINALEIKLNSDADEYQVRSKIEQIMGPKFETKNRYEQEETYFKVMNIEKYMSLLIGTLTIILIAFNLVGSLWMIVLEKKKDIAILKSMGSTRQNILGLFIKEGVFITTLGVILGIIISVIIYYIQINYGIIAMATSHIVQAYPIELRIGDILLVILIVSLIGFIAAVLPAKKAAEIPALIREE